MATCERLDYHCVSVCCHALLLQRQWRIDGAAQLPCSEGRTDFYLKTLRVKKYSFFQYMLIDGSEVQK